MLSTLLNSEFLTKRLKSSISFSRILLDLKIEKNLRKYKRKLEVAVDLFDKINSPIIGYELLRKFQIIITVYSSY